MLNKVQKIHLSCLLIVNEIEVVEFELLMFVGLMLGWKCSPSRSCLFLK